MVCPHPKWVEENREKEDLGGTEYLVITEKCVVCGAIRGRALPASMAEEPFDYSTPQSGLWYERLYNLGNFVILARKFQNNPERPPSYMTRVETQAGHVHVGMAELDTPLFSPSALQEIEDMERMLKLGPKRYASFRILKEGLTRKEQKDEIQLHATTLAQVVQDIGPESIAAARTLFEAEIDHEIQEQEEIQIQQMESEVAARKAQMEERRKQGKKPK
jgi:hypothetical protein